MDEPRPPLELLRTVVDALGGEAEHMVLAGGCAPALYELAPTVSELRPTVDVDCIVDAPDYAAYHALIRRLERDAGLRHVLRPGVPLCRYSVAGVEIDLMPTDASILGFTNRWYAEGVVHATRVRLGEGTRIRVLSPLYFVATKLVAIQDPTRGDPDLRFDPDVEDVVTVLRGVVGLIDSIGLGDQPIHAFVRAALHSLLRSPDALEILAAHFESDAATQRLVPRFLTRLRTAASASPPAAS